MLISMAFALLTYFCIRTTELSFIMISMILWNVFALTYILTSWIIFFTCSITQIRREASKEDGSRFFVFLVILISSFVSMLNVLLIIITRNINESSKSLYLPLAICGLMLSWIMVHTTFSFHYAHKYYNDDINDKTKHAEGLIFPNEKKPDYIDFAYFAFVIGMTFQVSDVEITSRQLRRIVLFHGLLSFGLSVFVLALTINIVSGLIH